MPTPSYHPLLSAIDDQVFVLQESTRKLELVEESLREADPDDTHHWNDILDLVMQVERQHMRHAFDQLKSLSCFSMEGTI